MLAPELTPRRRKEKSGQVVSIDRLEVIELRTDARYSGVIRDEPAQAKGNVTRADGRIKVE